MNLISICRGSLLSNLCFSFYLLSDNIVAIVVVLKEDVVAGSGDDKE